MINTFLPIKTSNNIYKKWYLIDAKEQKLGRLSTKISLLLTGKHKSDYTPSLNKGDYVIVINAKEIQVTGKKEKQKLYRSHSGRPGGMKIKTFTEIKNYFPEINRKISKRNATKRNIRATILYAIENLFG